MRFAKIWKLDDFKTEHNIDNINCVWDDGINKFVFYFHPNGFSRTIYFWSMPSACSDFQQHKLDAEQVYIAILDLGQYNFIGYWGNLQDFKDFHLKHGEYSNVLGFRNNNLSLVYIDPTGNSRHNNRKWGVIDIQGNEVIPVSFDYIKGWDTNENDEITLVNHGIGRTIFRNAIMNSKYCFTRPDNKGILGTCSFCEFLWIYDIIPNIEVRHSQQTSHDTLVIDEQYTIYVGKSLNYTFPNDKEKLLRDARVLIENGPKYYLYEDAIRPVAVIDNDNILKPYNSNSNSNPEIQQLINYYRPRVNITKATLPCINKFVGKKHSDDNGWDYEALFYDALEGDPDAYWNID